MPIKRTNYVYCGVRIDVDHGIAVKPRWYDIPRRLGLRPKKRHFTTKPGQVIVGPSFMIFHERDYEAVLPKFQKIPEMQTVPEACNG